MLSAITVMSQTLKKGNLIGVHVITVSLQEGVTMEQYIDFFENRYLPEINKTDPNWQVFLTKGIRGENANKFGLIHVIKSEQDRAKYINEDGTYTQTWKDVQAKIQPVVDKLNELGTYKISFTDWLIE